MSLFSKSIIGLELDSQEIRAVEIKGTRSKHTISAWGKVRLPDGVVKDGRVIDSDLFAASIDRLIKENSFKSRDVFFGVNNQDVIVRFATFPKVPEDKIRNMIQFQAQDYIPVAIDELELDYIVVSEKKSDEGEFINVVLVGARKKMINDYIEAFTRANVVLKEIDSTMFAMGRAALIGSDNGTFVLVGFNNDFGNILIFREGILTMARSVSITQSPAWNELKNTSPSVEQESDVIADILFGEIRSSIAYYKMQSGESLENILLFGCNSKQEHVCRRLRETTSMNVTIPMPYTYLENQVKKGDQVSFRASDYVAAISLALRGLGE